MTKVPQLRVSCMDTGKPISLPYGGKRLKGEVVDEVGGFYKPGLATEDVLVRSAQGQYFLAGEISLDTVEPCVPKRALPGDGFWLRVKRLSFRAAALYVTRGTAGAFRVDLLKVMSLGIERKEVHEAARA